MIIGIIWLICSLAVWVIYHKLFNVWYFDFAGGCFKELITCGFIGAILAAIIVAFWFISIPIVIIFLIIFFKKKID